MSDKYTQSANAAALQERIDAISTVMQIVDAAGIDGFEEDGTGGTLYSMFNSTDANLNVFTGDGGANYDDNIFSFLKTLSTYIVDGDGDLATGQALPSDTSLVDIIGDFTGPHDGTDQDDNIKASLDLANTDLDSILADVGDASGATLSSIFGILGNPSATLLSQLEHIYALADGGTNAYPDSVVQESIFAYIMSKSADPVVTSYDNTTDSLEAISDKLATGVGATQIIEVSVTGAANAGVTTVATITGQPCLIKSVVIHADTAQTANMTSCAVEGGVGQVVEFISAVTAVQASLDAADKQVSWTGGARLAATKLITIDLLGTEVTPVDLTVTIEYEACVAGGYLV